MHRLNPYHQGFVAAIFSLWLMLFSSHGVHAAELLIIVSEKNPLTTVSVADIKRIYKMKRRVWPNGVPVRAANMAESHHLRNDFSQQILKKRTAQMEVFYLKMALTGRGQPPYIASSNDEMIAFVRRHDGAIGYIDQPIQSPGIKILNISP